MLFFGVIWFAFILFEMYWTSLIWRIMISFKFGKMLAVISSLSCVCPPPFLELHYTYVKQLDVPQVTGALLIFFPLRLLSPLHFGFVLWLCFQGQWSSVQCTIFCWSYRIYFSLQYLIFHLWKFHFSFLFISFTVLLMVSVCFSAILSLWSVLIIAALTLLLSSPIFPLVCIC